MSSLRRHSCAFLVNVIHAPSVDVRHFVFLAADFIAWYCCLIWEDLSFDSLSSRFLRICQKKVKVDEEERDEGREVRQLLLVKKGES